MNIPDIVKGKVVPSTVQLHGETFHREANLDAYFCDISQKCDNLEATNADLLAALENAAFWLETPAIAEETGQTWRSALSQVRAAIAKAKDGKG